jgi:hypothetical protein
MSLIVGLAALLCIFFIFKVTSFLLRLTVVIVVVGAAYWYLAPHFGLPMIHF